MLFQFKVIAVAALLASTVFGIASAGAAPDDQTIRPGHVQQTVPSGQHEMRPGQQSAMGDPAGKPGSSTMPISPGQDAFGAIQEIVRILDADPKTDWSKVDLEALRQHLIDMNEVTLKAEAAPKATDGGLEIAVTGSGRTLVAIRRMIPAWVQMASDHNGWSAKAAELPNGELLTVTATDGKEVQHIRGLGFIGLLATGAWHQPHHLAMAKGAFDHEHLAHQH